MDGKRPEIMQDSEARTSVVKRNHQKCSHLDDDYSPLSGTKPFYLHVMVPSNLEQFYQLVIGVSMKNYLPSTTVPMMVTCRGKTWELIYHGGKGRKLAYAGWKKFAVESELKVGDALFWEIMESTEEKVHVKVQIIKGNCRPSEEELLVENEVGDGPIDLIAIE